MEIKKINSYIDHTILKPEATKEQVLQICDEAIKYQFASVCIHSYYTPLVAQRLKGTNVKPCVTIGFPLGCNSTEVKAFEAEDAIKNGATEIDMVINIGALKSGDLAYVKQDIAAVVKVAKNRALVKVILETCLLTDAEIVSVCKMAQNVGANFVKTSTGFNSAGAKVEHIKLMRKAVGPQMGVKASGGIKTYNQAIELIQAGATRIGASASVQIITEQEKALK